MKNLLLIIALLTSLNSFADSEKYNKDEAYFNTLPENHRECIKEVMRDETTYEVDFEEALGFCGVEIGIKGL